MYKIKPSEKITILSLSWRDIKSPKSGGAEIHTHEMFKRANSDRYRIIHISMGDDRNKDYEIIDGITYLRRGNFATVILYACLFYCSNRKNIDFVIDQCNTHRFFTKFYVNRKKRIFYIHQLTREIWDIHLGFPFNKIGKYLETALLRLNKDDFTITISDSTKKDLLDVGFDGNKVIIVPEYITNKPWEKEKHLEKKQPSQFVYCGRYAKYKGIDVSIEALAIVRKKGRDARLVVVGKKDEAYLDEVLNPLCKRLDLSISETDKDADVFLTGFISDDEKIKIMSESRCLLFPSIREGWGLIITEAAVVGTPSIVFNSPGSIDAVNKGKAGYLCEINDEKNVAEKMILSIDDEEGYMKMRDMAYDFSCEYLKWGENTDAIDEIIGKIQNENI